VDQDQDWRLEAELDAADTRGALDHLLGRLRGPDVVEDVDAAVPHDVVITHDGRRLFAYAANEATLTATRTAIAEVLQRDEVKASISVSHWDETVDEWRESGEPGSAAGEPVTAAERLAERSAEAVRTRTMVASSGKLVRAEFEQSMLAFASEHSLRCEVVEHPHLLSTQVAFTVTGPNHKIDEFAAALRREGWATFRVSQGL
jgi:hypothetical protein